MTNSDNEQNHKKAVTDASKLFGTPIKPYNVIGEALQRITDDSKDLNAIAPQLPSAVTQPNFQWPDFAAFTRAPCPSGRAHAGHQPRQRPSSPPGQTHDPA